MSRIENLLLYVLFAGSFLVEVRLPIVAFSAGSLTVPLAAVALALSRRGSIADIFRAERRLALAALAVWAWAWVSAVHGVAPALSLRYVAKYTGHLVVFAALLVFLRRAGVVAPAQRVAYRVLVVLAVLGIVEHWFPDWRLLTLFRARPPGYPRVSSLMVEENSFGVLLAIAVGFGAALRWARRIGAPVHAAALPLLLVALALTGSRNGWLVLAVLVAVLSAARVLSLRRVAAIGASFAILLVSFPVPRAQLGLDALPGLLAGTPRTTLQPRIAGTTPPSETLQSRLALWRAAVDEIERRPLAGIGLEVFANTIGPRIARQKWINTHDLFLNVATELGLVGLGLVLVFLRELLRCGDPRDWTVSIPLLGVGVGQLFDCFTYDHAFMTFAVFFAACYASVPRARG